MSKKISQQEYERRIEERFPEESFTVLEYTSTAKPAIIKCNSCGDIIKVSRALNFLAPNKVNGCKKCKGLWIERDKKIQEILQYYDIVKTEVKDTHIHYTIKCKKCGHERTSTLHNLYSHLQCGCETGVYRNRTAEEFIQEANQYCREGSYKLISEYKNQTTKVLLQHSCGFIWEVRPADVIHGDNFCPKCGKRISKGESLVQNILNELNIEAKREWIIPNTLLRFDFYFILGEQKFAIEYNGIQHYEQVEHFGNRLEVQQERDKRKKEYCENNNIILIEIPYWVPDERVKSLIVNKLNDYLERE